MMAVLDRLVVVMPLSEGVTMKRVYTAFVEYDEESKLYVGIIPNVPGAHTQGETLDELQHNLHEVLELCLEEWRLPCKPVLRLRADKHRPSLKTVLGG